MNIKQRIKCFFGKHDYKHTRGYLLQREKCDCCNQERVLLPSGRWEKVADIDPGTFTKTRR